MTRTAPKQKAFGGLLIVFAVFAFALIILRVTTYRFQYDPVHYPVDYGRWNFFSFFTVQSNLYAAVFVGALGLGRLGAKRAKAFAESPAVRLTAATYILVTGLVYCGGIPLKMTPPLYWTDLPQTVLSVTQIFHHVVMPLTVLALFFFTPGKGRFPAKKLPAVAAYPLVYSLFSIARGVLAPSHFYPYPFYRPETYWRLLSKTAPVNLPAAFALMLPALLLGVSLFVVVAAVLRLAEKKIQIIKE